MLESNDAGIGDAFAALEQTLGNSVEPARLKALRADIEDFNFDGALAKLDRIATGAAV